VFREECWMEYDLSQGYNSQELEMYSGSVIRAVKGDTLHLKISRHMFEVVSAKDN